MSERDQFIDVKVQKITQTIITNRNTKMCIYPLRTTTTMTVSCYDTASCLFASFEEQKINKAHTTACVYT